MSRPSAVAAAAAATLAATAAGSGHAWECPLTLNRPPTVFGSIRSAIRSARLSTIAITPSACRINRPPWWRRAGGSSYTPATCPAISWSRTSCHRAESRTRKRIGLGRGSRLVPAAGNRHRNIRPPDRCSPRTLRFPAAISAATRVHRGAAPSVPGQAAILRRIEGCKVYTSYVTPYRAIVFGQSSPAFLAARTIRALADSGIRGEDFSGSSSQSMADRLTEAATPIWFLRTGSWPVRDVLASALPASSTGRALCALGATVAVPDMPADADVDAWQTALKATGGHFDEGNRHMLPPLDSFYLEPPVVAAIVVRLRRGEEFMPAVLAELTVAERRVVRVAALDVHRDKSLRVAQVITSLPARRGGTDRLGPPSRTGPGRLPLAAGRPGPCNSGRVRNAARLRRCLPVQARSRLAQWAPL